MSNYEFFKFSPIGKNLIDSLIKGYIYCASPASLNDPLDCRVDLRAALRRAIESTDGIARTNLETQIASEEFLSRIQSRAQTVGIASFSSGLLKPMMWSHYADHHRGVCLHYRIPSSFIDYDKNGIIGISSVFYGQNVLTEALIAMAPDLHNLNQLTLVREIMPRLFTAKGEDWSVENEIRIVRKTPGQLLIDRKFLVKACFGMATPQQDIDLVRGIIERCGDTVTFCKAEPSDQDFNIMAIDLQQDLPPLK
jgi:Protein of unknown function (DUF2971)